MTISPSYRGADITYAMLSKTTDLRVPQSEWNLDTMDGNGPSGYQMDLTKMQMFYIDYSWYGAGFVRFGMRGIDGTVHYCHKILNNNVNSEAYLRSGNLPARYESNTFANTTKLNTTLTNTATTIAVDSVANFAPSGTLLIRGGSTYEYVNYSGINTTLNTFTGVTRAKAGVPAGTTITIAAGSNIGTVASTTGIQVGQRIISSAFPDNTYISELVGSTLKFNTAALTANPTGVVIAPMAATTGQTFTVVDTTPVSVEQAFPTYSASISHWGTSVIMDGRYDDDKSLIFTFGQTTKTTIPPATTEAAPVTTTTTSTVTPGSYTVAVTSAAGLYPGMQIKTTFTGSKTGSVIKAINGTTLTMSLPFTALVNPATSISFFGGNQRALFSIRVAPSVDNGISAKFGARELINRMQLVLRSLAVTASTNANMLVTAILNGTPSTATEWTNAVKNSTVLTNSSLAQIADYSGLADASSAIILGGEITGGFYVNSTTSVDLTDVRDLGNSILGGGDLYTNTNVYPDGPDVLSIVVTNLSASAVDVLGRLGWSEAQA
jgi:hypothetical protein